MRTTRSSRRLSRREMLRLMGMGGASLAGVGILGGACAPATPAPVAPTATTPPEPTATAQRTTRLQMMSFQVDLKAFWEPLLAETEAATNTRIEVDWVEFSAMIPKLKASLAGGEAPDLFFAQVADLHAFAAAGELLDLSPFLDADNRAWRDSFDAGVFDTFATNGKTWGIPQEHGAMALYYNRGILESHGLEPPEKLSDMLSWPEALGPDGIGAFGWGSGDAWYPDRLLFPIVGQTAGAEKVLAADAGEQSWAAPEFVRAFEVMLEMRDGGLLPTGFEGMGWQDVKKVFYGQKAATWFFGSWQIDIFRAEEVVKTANRDGIDIGVTFFPAVDGGRQVISSALGGGWAVSAGTQEPEAVVSVLKYIFGPEGRRAAAAAYKLPTGPVDLTGIDFEEPYLSLFNFFDKNRSAFVPRVISTSEVAVAIRTAVQSLMTGGVTPEQAAQMVEDASQSAQRG